MRVVMGIMVFILIIGLAESVQLGGTAGRAILLGGMSKNALDQAGVLNQTNVTNETNITNQTTVQNKGNAVVAIGKSMSPIPVTNRYKGVTMPNNIEANSIAYRFTT